MNDDFSGALVPLGDGDFPAPTDLKVRLTEQLNAHVQRIRDERGEVTGPEDTFDLIRRLTAAGERLGDYGRAFMAVAKTTKDIVEEEHLEAVGDSDGIPASNLKVPTAGGDISITRDLQNQYDIDMDQVVAVLAAQTALAWGERACQDLQLSTPSEQPEQFAIEVALTALSFVGAAKPKVTSVRALAEQLSRDGDDQLAKVARDSIRKTVKYRGVNVKVERKAS
jgi:hypothetical protein